MNYKIGVFDSGIGGFTILEELKKLLPNESFLYYKDSKNNPYGEKSEEKLFQITSEVVEYLQVKGCKIIVIACNTATTKCMKKLRLTYKNLIFIGTVPAIKVACDQKFQNTIVMATPATIESERTLELIKENKKKNQNIYLLSCKGLAHAIERKDQEQIEKLLYEYLKSYQNKNIDSIVLGCTHYPIIKEKILKILPHVVLIDGSVGVAKEVKKQLEYKVLLHKNKSQEIKIVTSII